jgi:hypothetical protein
VSDGFRIPRVHGPVVTMSTVEASSANQDDYDVYDPNDVYRHDTPPLRKAEPKLAPTPEPHEGTDESEYDTTPPGSPGQAMKPKRAQPIATPGDTVLVSLMGNGKNPDVASHAGKEILPQLWEGDPIPPPLSSMPDSQSQPNQADSSANTTSLAGLAASALAAVSHAAPPVPQPPPRKPLVSEAPKRSDSLSHGHTPREAEGERPNELAPLLSSPKRSNTNGVTLPSLSAQLGDLKHLAEAAIASSGTDGGGHRLSFSSQSPPQPSPFAPLGPGKMSPPHSPNDAFRRELHSLSPGQTHGANQYYPRRQSLAGDGRLSSYLSSAGPSPEYQSSSTETPSTENNGPSPGMTNNMDRMKINEITNPAVGYRCHFKGCSAQPFQTQYLLNSHANVHSNTRPHYCPVPGCGKSFKRKNEMIRHGLVHQSPGYVCPFCVDREHKYPRPDNLLRSALPHPS